MKKYVLMQAPKEDERDCTPQILIIDNSTYTGKARVDRLLNEGYSFVGTVETDLNVAILKNSICRYQIDQLDAYHSKMREIYQLANDALMTI